MKKSSLRSFGIACFVIGMLITFSEKVNIPFISSSETNAAEKYQNKITQLEQQLQDANEQISALEQTDPTTETVTEDKPSEEQNTESEEKPVASEPEVKDETVTDTLYVYAGLTPAEVAQKLKDMNIIKNSVEMELFLAQPEYATTIQKGQFELNSSMSVEEIANIITGKSR